MMPTRNLPVIQELYDEKDVELLKRENDLNVLLNQTPKPEWIKDHPMASGVKYIPIGRIEWLLTRIFIKWHVEVKDLKLIGNSVVVTVRLHYLSPIDGEWDWQDGIGANPLQTDKGAGAIDFDKLKNDAVMKAAPAAESYAVKDAAEKLGKLFGKDLNRKDEIGYDVLLNTFAGDKPEGALLVMKKVIEGLDKYKGKDLEAIKKQCVEHQRANTFTIEFAKEIGAKIGVEI
jgi:hypothetical protein